MRKRTVGSWNAAPSLKSYLSFSHVARSLLISRSSSLRLWSSRMERVPPSISFCLSSKQEFLSSLFVFPLSVFRCLSRYVAFSSSFGPPLSSAIAVPFLSFLSSFGASFSVFFQTRCFSLFLSFSLGSFSSFLARGSQFVYD